MVAVDVIDARAAIKTRAATASPILLLLIFFSSFKPSVYIIPREFKH